MAAAPRAYLNLLLEVEEGVLAQVLSHLVRVVAKSAPVGTPRHGHPSLRFLAPPSPRPTRFAGLGRGPRSWTSKKSGAAADAAAPRAYLNLLLEVEEGVLTQVLGHLVRVVAKSAPVGTPRHGHPSLRFLAPPSPRPTRFAGLGRGPRSWTSKKAGPLRIQRPLVLI